MPESSEDWESELKSPTRRDENEEKKLNFGSEDEAERNVNAEREVFGLSEDDLS